MQKTSLWVCCWPVAESYFTLMNDQSQAAQKRLFLYPFSGLFHPALSVQIQLLYPAFSCCFIGFSCLVFRPVSLLPDDIIPGCFSGCFLFRLVHLYRLNGLCILPFLHCFYATIYALFPCVIIYPYINIYKHIRI